MVAMLLGVAGLVAASLVFQPPDTDIAEVEYAASGPAWRPTASPRSRSTRLPGGSTVS